MIRTVSSLSLLTAVLVSAAHPAAAEDGAKVEAVAVAVTGQVDEEAFEFSPLQGQPGTRVSLAIDASGLGATIVGLDDEASKVSAFTDAQGNDLLESQNEGGGMFSISFGGGSSPIGAFPKVSEDGTMMVLDIEGPATPAAGSGAITLKASLALRIAEGTVTRKSGPIPLSAGKVVDKDGGITIDSVGDVEWGDAAMSVTMKMPVETLDQIAKIAFYNAAGEDITDGQRSTMTMLDRAEVMWELTEKVDTATIELTLHDKMRKLEVPVDLTVTLGL